MGYGINLYKVKMNFNVCNLILHKFFHYDSTYVDTKKGEKYGMPINA